jgi:TonB-linked SusC/RagA family outer membrane protein
MLLLLGIVHATAQTRTYSGRIVDSAGAPVEGASIALKGGTRGTISNAQGNFSISAQQGGTLVISAINFATQEIRLGDQTNISVVLFRAESQLNEVVVTALGLRRSRNSLPYATQQVSGADISRTPTTNFVNNLSGKVSGLQITASNAMGGSTNAILRGMKSLTQSNQALFVVDGVPYDNTNQSRSGIDLGNTASDINPEDIESVNVLKGAAASALYGSRASNGVILITTKKGSKNRRGIGVAANFGITVGTPDNSTLPTYQTEYGQGFGSADITPSNPNPDEPGKGFFYYKPTFNSNGQNVLIVQTNNDAATGPAYDPNLMVYNWDAFTPGNPNYGKATPWKPAAHYKPQDFFVTPITTTEGVYVDGGGDRGTFKLGYTRSDDKGFLPNSSVKRNLINFGATYDLTSKVTIGGTLNYSDNNGIGRYGYTYAAGGVMTDFRQWWPTNVDIKQQKADYFNTLTNATWNWPNNAYLTNTPGNIATPSYHDNLYWQMYENYESDSRTRYFGNVHLNYKITDYLSVLGRISKDRYDQLMETRVNIGSSGTSGYTRYNQTYDETNYDLLINFDKNIGNNFNLKALLGGNVRQQNIQSIFASTSGGLVVPRYYAIGNSASNPDAPVETYIRKEVDGVFGGFTLAYKDMLTLDATLRRDRSSSLPKGNNSYYYPSVSANYVFSKSMRSQNWLSYGKLWVNYAEVGGDAEAYSTLNTFLNAPPFNGNTLFGAPFVNRNPNLMPERNKAYEIGLEARFLKNRLGFTVDYYHSKQTDQIMPVSVSNATGFSTFVVNGGAVQNQGVEVSLNVVPVRGPNFSWDMTVNWSKNINKVLSLYNNQPSYTIQSYQNSVQLVAEVGKPYGVIRGTDYTYDKATGQRIVDASGQYILADNPLSDIGNMNPDWLGSISNSLSYKNISLNFLVDVRQGGQLYSLDMDYGSYSGLYPRTAGLNDLGKPVRAPLSEGGGIILKGVTEDGKPNTVRIDESDINTGNYSFSSGNYEAHKEFIYDASYVKLREVAITYSFPKKTIEKWRFIKGLDISLTGRNLWIIHKNLPYADPEQGQASGNGSMGYQNGAYPIMRTFGANLRVKF